MGGVRYQCVGNDLSVGGASGSVVRPIIMVHVRVNGGDSGRNPYNLPKSDHEEEGAEKHIWDVDNNGRRRVIEGILNEDSGHIHHPQAGGGGAVGVFKTAILSLCTESRV